MPLSLMPSSNASEYRGNPGSSEAVTTQGLACRRGRDLLGKKIDSGEEFSCSAKNHRITEESLFLVALLCSLSCQSHLTSLRARQKCQPRDLMPLAAEPTMALQIVMYFCC